MGRKLALAAAALALALLSAEVFLRVLFPVGAGQLTTDDELLYANLPDAHAIEVLRGVDAGRWVRIRQGPEGFRGPGMRTPKAGLRIALCGDSLAFNGNVDWEQTFGERLAAGLKERLGQPVEVVNLGVAGYGPGQTALALERWIDVVTPDLVLLLLCAHNDHGDLLRNKLFRLDEGQSLVRVRPTLESNLRALFEGWAGVAEYSGLRRLYRFFRQTRQFQRLEDERVAYVKTPAHTRSRASMVKLYLDALHNQYEDFVVHGNDGVFSLFEDNYDADVALDPDGEAARYKRRLFTLVLWRMRRTCAQRDIPLLTLGVPSAVDLMDDFAIKVDARARPSYSPARLTELLSAMAEGLDLEHLDLYSVMRSGDPNDLFVGGYDFHWNAAGQALAADVAADWMLASALAPR